MVVTIYKLGQLIFAQSTLSEFRFFSDSLCALCEKLIDYDTCPKKLGLPPWSMVYGPFSTFPYVCP